MKLCTERVHYVKWRCLRFDVSFIPGVTVHGVRYEFSLIIGIGKGDLCRTLELRIAGTKQLARSDFPWSREFYVVDPDSSPCTDSVKKSKLF